MKYLYYVSCIALLLISQPGFSQGGSMRMQITQPTDSLTNDGSLQISLPGISHYAHLAVYQWNISHPATLIDTGYNISHLGWGIYLVIGNFYGPPILTDSGYDNSPQSYMNYDDLFGAFVIGNSNISSFQGDTITRPYLSDSNYVIQALSIKDPAQSQCNGSLVCDGRVLWMGPFVEIIGNSGTSYYTNDSFPLNAPRDTFNGLCEGRYIVSLSNLAGGIGYTFFTGSEANAFPPVGASAIPTPVSAQGACDGTVTLSALHGLAPYTWFLDSVPQSSNVFTGVCEGLHSFFVTDSVGISSPVQDVVVGELPHYYVINPDTFSGPVIDTVYSYTQDCNFNYNVQIDSAHLDTIITTSVSNEYILQYDIWQQGQHIYVTDTVIIDSVGVNQIDVALYCDTLHRSIQGTLFLVDYINTAPKTTNGINPVAANDLIYIYPNPIGDAGFVTVQMPQNVTCNLAVTDILGRNITVPMSGNAGKTILDMREVPAGIYTVTASGMGNTTAKQLIKY